MKFDLQSLFTGKYAQWISMGFIGLFALLIIIEWSYLIFFPLPSSIQTKQEMPIPAKQNSFDDLMNSALFGVYLSNNLNDSNVKKSMLNVTVVGILFAKDKNNSQVIIRSAQGEDKTYKVGETIPGEAVIKQIMESGILVERHGTLESLSFPKNGLNFEPVAKPLQEE